MFVWNICFTRECLGSNLLDAYNCITVKARQDDDN